MAKWKTNTLKRDENWRVFLVTECRIYQWAAKIVSELPADSREARMVLHRAEQLRKDWLPNTEAKR